MNKEQQQILKFPEFNSGTSEKVTYSVRKDPNGHKKRVTTLLPGNPQVGEEFTNTNLLHSGNKTTVKCVSGEGYVLIRQFQRDGKGNIVPHTIVNLQLQFFGKNHEIVIFPDNFCQFGNIGSELLILEDDSPEKNPELADPKNPFNWPSASDLFTVRNIGFKQTFTKGEGRFPSLAVNPSYGKNAEKGNLFPKN